MLLTAYSVVGYKHDADNHRLLISSPTNVSTHIYFCGRACGSELPVSLTAYNVVGATQTWAVPCASISFSLETQPVLTIDSTLYRDRARGSKLPVTLMA